MAQSRSEDNPSISRIQSLHLLLDIDDHDEEEYSVVLTLGNRLANNLLAQHQSTFFSRWVKFLWMGWQEYISVVLLQPLIGSQKHVHSISTQILQTSSQRFLLVVVVIFVAQVRDQLIQAMRNSDPRVRIVFVYRIKSNLHSIFTLQVAGCNF